MFSESQSEDDSEFSSDKRRPSLDDLLTAEDTGFGDEVQEGKKESASSSVSAENEEEEKGRSSSVAVAMPPRDSERSINFQEIALSGSVALDALDQLVASNSIGKEKAAKLRRRYNSLREILESSHKAESKLVEQAKLLGHQLTSQRKVLESAEAFPDGSSSQMSILRQVLLGHQNELDMCEARLEKQKHEISMLEGETAALEKQYVRQPKKEELESHIKELSKVVDGLNDEIALRSQDIQRYQRDMDKRNGRIAGIQLETDELHQLQDVLQQELINLRNGPNISKEIEIVKRDCREVSEKSRSLDKDLHELQSHISEADQRNTVIHKEFKDLSTRVDAEREMLNEKEVSLEQLNKFIAMGKEREAKLLEDRAMLEIRERHRKNELRTLSDALSFKTKEKDKELKSLKKYDLQLISLRESKEQIDRQAAVLEEIKDKQKAEHDSIMAGKEEVLKEVMNIRKGLKRKEGLTESEQVQMNTLLVEEEEAKASATRQQLKLRNLTKDIILKTKARDKESRLWYQTMKEFRKIKSDLRTKETSISDQHKKIIELDAELSDSHHAYELVKAERNKTHSQILVLQQIGAELAEKSKVLKNEIEILRTTADEKERVLQKCSMVYSTKVMERDTLRQELGKVKTSQNELGTDLNSKRECIQKLTQQINDTEKHLNMFRRRYEQTVQERNDLGLQLIERNEEVCVFYEKLNVQESILREANLKLDAREEEIKMLNLKLKEFQNSISLYRKKTSNREKMEAELTISQVDLKTCEEQLRALEKAVEDSSDPARLNLLPGDNPTRKELNDKLDKVEDQLAHCEQHLLEKELLYEQVSKLTDRANRKVEVQRSTTLAVAKKVNQYQAKIKDVTRKMMAMVSELSMEQASALRLQQESRELESKVQQAYVRLENGEAPDEEALLHWEKTLLNQNRKKQEEMAAMKMEEEENARMLSGGMVTTAEPRPNAYMPSGEGELPVPKPYGSHAPFKPTQLGANLRHIRKPLPQPIDI